MLFALSSAVQHSAHKAKGHSVAIWVQQLLSIHRSVETWLVGTGKRLSREKTLGRALGTSGGQACPSVFSRLSRMPGPTSQASTHQVGSQQLLGLDRYHVNLQTCLSTFAM